MKDYMTSLRRRAYLWACERLYAEFAWSYDTVAWGVSRGHWAAWRRAVLPWVQGPDVLEIGFGTGALLREMAAAGWQVTGVERSSAMQLQAARGAGRRPLRIQAAAQQMPLMASSCDSVVATFPAPYITEAATMAEVARVLKPGGRLVIGGLWVADVQSVVAAPAGPPAALLYSLVGLMREVGLAPTVTEARVDGAQVGIALGRKPGGCHATRP